MNTNNNMSGDCSFHSEYELGPLNIDYARVYYCNMRGYEGITILCLVFWVAFLTNLLGNTAENYFSPTLASICLRLKLSHDIAGVTFLAFGNGAPDVFSSITSFSGAADVMIGIGSLLGGSVFVTTVVVGSIAILNPCEVEPSSFLRNVGFHLVATSMLAMMAVLGRLHILFSLCFFVAYGVYAVVVSVSTMSEEHTLGEQEQRVLAAASTNQIQTAFWHKSASRSPRNANSTARTTPSASSSSTPPSSVKFVDGATSKGGYSKGINSNIGDYKFLTLAESTVRSSATNSEEANAGPGGGILNEDGEINLSGGIISPELDAEIIENYFSPMGMGIRGVVRGESEDIDMTKIIDRPIGYRHHPPPHGIDTNLTISTASGGSGLRRLSPNSKSTAVTSVSPMHGRGGTGIKASPSGWLRSITSGTNSPTGKNKIMTESGGASIEMMSADSLTHSLLANNDEDEEEDIEAAETARLTNRVEVIREADSYDVQDNEIDLIADRDQYHSAIYSLYWQQYLLRRRLQRCLMSAEWWSYPWGYKLLALIEYPAVFARDVTIPTVDEGTWWKPYAVIQPVASTLFIIFISGNNTTTVLLFGSVLSVIPAVVVFFATHYSHPPTNAIFGGIWVLFAFVMCSAWVYLLAGELVACLTAVGVVFRIPPIYLGLTVLAWGNSIGDFFSNISIAKKGLGQMALAGCYGGPVFNILVGLGLALTYACYQHYPQQFVITFNVSSIVSLLFLYGILITTMVIVSSRKFRVEKWLGYLLLGIYGLHTLCQAVLLATGTK